MKTRLALTLGLLSVWLLSGCVPETSLSDVTSAPMATPTTFTFFTQTREAVATETQTNDSPSNVPTIASLFIEPNTPEPTATSTPFPTSPPLRPNFLLTDAITKTIYDDALNENWAILEDTGSIFDTASDIRVRSGQHSIAFTPQVDFAMLFFTVKPETTVSYPFGEVIGISFWLNSGDDYLQLDELAISVVGSNEINYWVANDDSVKFPAGETFSETRLYFLGLNRSIPPETWVEVYLPIDSLIYDPEYQFITGFYLKNDVGFTNTIYIDDVNFIMLASSAETPVPTASATPESADSPSQSETPTSETPTAVSATPAITPTTSTCVISPPSGWVSYRIQSGDSLANLAYEANASLELVLSVNCLPPNSILSIGKEIWLPSLPATETP